MIRIELQVNTRTDGDWTVVYVEGEIDLYTAPKLREALIEVLASGPSKLGVNLERVSFMDSMGIGALIGARRRQVERDGDFAIVCGESPALRVLEISGLTSVFTVLERLSDPG